MSAYEVLKLLHIIGATVLFGTGMGIAFFMVMADRAVRRGGDIAALALTTRHVVLADYLFTATAAVLQPMTGALLIHTAGYAWGDTWVWLSLLLYGLVGACWLPVVWLQSQMRDMAEDAAEAGEELPERYHRFYRLWFFLGWPAFLAVIAIMALMIVRPL